MASVANVDAKFLKRTARLECISTRTSYGCFKVLRVNAIFHRTVYSTFTNEIESLILTHNPNCHKIHLDGYSPNEHGPY